MRFLALTFALAIAPVIVAAPARPAHAAEADLKKRLKDLKKKNAEMSAELAKKKAESQQLFQQVSAAENAAGFRGLSCHGVASAKAPDPGFPVTGVPHARLRVKRGTFVMSATFEAARPAGAWRTYPGNCQAAKQ